MRWVWAALLRVLGRIRVPVSRARAEAVATAMAPTPGQLMELRYQRFKARIRGEA